MNPYPGIASLTISTGPTASPGVIVTSGSGDPHGWWPSPLAAEGNDARSAANLMAAVEAATDRTNWIGWRTPDWIAGGDYSTLFTGTVFLGGILSFKGGTSGIVIAASSKIAIGSALLGTGTLEVTQYGTLLLDAGSSALQQGSWFKSGNGAYVVGRQHTISAGTTGVHPEDYDTIVCTGTSYIVALADPNTSAPGGLPLPAGIRCRITRPGYPLRTGGGLTVQINDSGGNTIGNLYDGTNPIGSSWMDVETYNNSGTIIWLPVGATPTSD